MHLRLQFVLPAASSLVLFLCAPLRAQEAAAGPTPFPPANDQAAWPGKGVIRVFDWFKPIRGNYWSQREKKQGAIVFTGDSLIENWRAIDKAFPNMNVANRGIGGDVSRGLLFRFREDVLDLHPRAVVILIGTNDLSAHGNPDDVISNISDMLAMAQKQDPAMPVAICTVPPRNNPKSPTQPGKQDELNGKIKGLAQGREHVRILDLVPVFSMADGAPDPQYFNPDLLHFAGPGYVKFQEMVQKLFEEMHVR